MILRSVTKILLLIYGLSIMGGSFMEVAHEILHRVENTLHHHRHEHHHSVEDHHISLDADGSSKNGVAEMSNLGTYFLYFESPLTILSVVRIKKIYSIHRLFGFVSLSVVPSIPPPSIS